MTDKEFQMALAKMLPEKIKIVRAGEDVNEHLTTLIDRFYWISADRPRWHEIETTEWPEVCRLVEQKLNAGNNVATSHRGVEGHVEHNSCK